MEITGEKIDSKTKHTSNSFIYGGSIFWHKISYYGWRSILFLLLFDESKNQSESETTDLFFWIFLGLSVSYLLGGAVGDFLIGNKTTSIIGGSLIFIGAILFFVIPTVNPYLPITIFIVGCGLYESNLKAIYGKLYLHDKKLLDAGFLLLYLFINLGAFFGTFLIGLITSHHGFEYGFLAVSITTALSVSFILMTKKSTKVSSETIPNSTQFLNNINLKQILVVLFVFALYSFALKLTYLDIDAFYWKIDFGLNFTKHYWNETLSFYFYLAIGIFLVVLWSKKYYKHITKLTFSTIITLISFSVSFFFFKEDTVSTVVISVFAMFAYTIASLLVEPIIASTIVKAINPKYLGIAFGSITLLSMGIGYVFVYMERGLELIIENPFYIGLGIFLLLVGLLLGIRFKILEK